MYTKNEEMLPMISVLNAIPLSTAMYMKTSTDM
jgi:hypothetical protein